MTAKQDSSEPVRSLYDSRVGEPAPRIPDVMNSDPRPVAGNNLALASSQTIAERPPVANASDSAGVSPAAGTTGPEPAGLLVQHSPDPVRTYASMEGSENSEPVSVLDQLYGRMPGSGEAPAQQVQSGETYLELPSNLVMADETSERVYDARSREQFWDQFSEPSKGDKKRHMEGYDSPRAILSNGFWFAGADVLFIEPIFSGNPAILIDESGAVHPISADFGFDTAVRVHGGFETNAGPGVRFSFFRYNDETAEQSFTSDGVSTGQVRFLFDGGAGSIRLAATNPGDVLSTRQQIKIRSSEVAFYKDQKNLVSVVRGSLGIRHVILQQVMDAGLDAAAGLPQRFRSFNDFQALGPQLGIDYFRPVGHTDLELQSGMSGSLLFGRRDHSVTSMNTGSYFRDGKSESLPVLEMYLGLQWNIELSKCQTMFARIALESQYWANSGTPSETDANTGFYGLSAGFGITR